jgi:hypothetical protein
MGSKKRKKPPTEVVLDTGRVLVGSCLDRLKELDDASVDSIVTDPPYELGFMGKAWDASGVAYNVELWRECLRVLKPGGHLLAFGGTRTYHRMAVAIEDAGFEIRDSIHWLYGSGFPKSLDVSKAIDKAAGAEREVVGTNPNYRPVSGRAGYQGSATFRQTDGMNDLTAPATDAAKQWSGWGTALKPAHEPIVVARKPLAGTVAANVREHGTGALNIDGCRVGDEVRTTSWSGTANYKVSDPKDGATTSTGRWPANIVLTHGAECDGTCVPGCPVAELDRQSGQVGAAAPASGPTYSGPSKSGSMAGAFKGNGDNPPAFHNDTGGASRFFTVTEWDELDGAPFLYVAKPGKKERNAGLDGLPKVTSRQGMGGTMPVDDRGKNRDRFEVTQQNTHPTVKPVELMRHLVRLVTPSNGTVLDPFLGSGTTAVAAILEGKRWVGCELTADYLSIIEGRVKHAEKQVAAEQPSLFES